ncbi:MAG: hypothetical protein ICV64_00735 [Thermoleophilia bacterium]|nr:hypothetical protein [Thermoleophilia bacterium]
METVFRELAAVPEDELAALRADPAWQGRVAVVHTVTRELRAIAEAALDAEQAARITVPTLLLTGAESSEPSALEVEAVAAALPDARIAVLDGQHHVADVLAPEIFVEPVLRFLREE